MLVSAAKVAHVSDNRWKRSHPEFCFAAFRPTDQVRPAGRVSPCQHHPSPPSPRSPSQLPSIIHQACSAREPAPAPLTTTPRLRRLRRCRGKPRGPRYALQLSLDSSNLRFDRCPVSGVCCALAPLFAIAPSAWTLCDPSREECPASRACLHQHLDRAERLNLPN